MRIYTITLNPAYDIHAYMERFEPFHENLAHVISRQAGGKGVNISRALCSNGIENTALVVLGTDNCTDFVSELSRIDVCAVYLERPGRIRDNLTLHCDEAPETRISFSGFEVNDEILRDLDNTMTVDCETVITFTGRIPSGISKESAISYLAKWKKQGAKLVLDSKSLTLEDIYAIKPWLIKPNQDELSTYFSEEVSSMDSALEKAKQIYAHGVENVMISMGDAGALLLTDGIAYIAKPPVVRVVSTIGAGDSSIAGFITASSRCLQPGDCLRYAVAFGTASCPTEGTLPPNKTDVQAIYEGTFITAV